MPIIVWLAGLPAGDAEAAQAEAKSNSFNDPLTLVERPDKALLFGFYWHRTKNPKYWAAMYLQLKALYEDNP